MYGSITYQDKIGLMPKSNEVTISEELSGQTAEDAMSEKMKSLVRNYTWSIDRQLGFRAIGCRMVGTPKQVCKGRQRPVSVAAAVKTGKVATALTWQGRQGGRNNSQS